MCLVYIKFLHSCKEVEIFVVKRNDNYVIHVCFQTPISSVPSTPVVSKVKIEKLESSESGTQRLQAAFIHFNRMNIVCDNLILFYQNM